MRLEDPLDPKGLRTQAQRIMKAHSKPTKAPGRRRTSHSKHPPRSIAHGQPQRWNQQSAPVQLALTEQGYIRRCVGCIVSPRFPAADKGDPKKPRPSNRKAANSTRSGRRLQIYHGCDVCHESAAEQERSMRFRQEF